MEQPKWAREIERFFPVKSQFVLWGNIYDVYPMKRDENIIPLNINDYMTHLLLDNEYDLVLSYEPLYGFSIEEGSEEHAQIATKQNITKKNPLQATLEKAVEVFENTIFSSDVSTAILLKFSSRFGDVAKDDIDEFYYKMFRLLQNAIPKMTPQSSIPKFNTIIWLVDKENDLPAWYSLDNPKLKSIPMPKPDFLVRKIIIENLSPKMAGFEDLDKEKRDKNISLFVDQTNSLHASEIISIVTLARREKIAFKNIHDAIKMYKLGIVENEWAKIPLEKLENSFDYLSKRVKGQSEAVVKTGDILKRAYFNLSGSQYSKYSSRPKGVLFFAGPTGVGKTELAKSVTELIFGSETSYIRFDMSEFSHEHADQRLIGAPPGYVGYETGGELTNAVKQNPFTVILFDEIEKANPKILDIFLQILDDGRLTSGSGETVYFSECLIIFTSNLGIYEVSHTGERIQNVDISMGYEDINKAINKSIDEYFKYKLQRPEILNRIGDNIIVFDYIRADVAADIFNRMIDNVTENIKESYAITLSISLTAKEKLLIFCSEDLNMGGRGIGNKLEAILVNPLSRLIFEMRAKKNEQINITDVAQEGRSWKLIANKL